MNEPLDVKSTATQYILRWPAASGSVIQSSYTSLAAALSGLLQHEPTCLGDNHAAPLPPWEITCQLPDRAAPPGGRPRYVYHVNARAAGGGGDGSEESPWWGLATAVEHLTRLDQVGQIKLRARQTLR